MCTAHQLRSILPGVGRRVSLECRLQEDASSNWARRWPFWVRPFAARWRRLPSSRIPGPRGQSPSPSTTSWTWPRRASPASFSRRNRSPKASRGSTTTSTATSGSSPNSAIWRNDPTEFRLDLFHPGFIYFEAVEVSIVENGRASRIPFSPTLFAYGDQVPALGDLDGVGFAGFRGRYPINAPGAYQEFVIFLGASYFRALARNQVYGLSARGLAINTAEPEGEEFPAFRKFWIEKPGAEADTVVIYALLESQSATGAYRFAITPGAETVLEVEAQLFTRTSVKKMGIAPLTSMYLFNGLNRTGFDDYRLAVHDSDGLQILTGNGEWLWRPLANPAKLQISYFGDRRPRGFGLMQRSRSYEEFGDAEAKYERRPSVWIEPQGDWGDGFVELVEIPTDREINDNIVAYWRPKSAVPPGGPRQVLYRMRWTDFVLPPAELLWISASRSGLSFDRNSANLRARLPHPLRRRRDRARRARDRGFRFPRQRSQLPDP